MGLKHSGSLKNMANSKILIKNNFIRKAMTKGKMSLNFEINTDIKTDLVDFRDLLKEGLEIIEAEISKYKR